MGSQPGEDLRMGALPDFGFDARALAERDRLRRLGRLFIHPQRTAGLGTLLSGSWLLSCEHVVCASRRIRCASLQPGGGRDVGVARVYLEGETAGIDIADWPARARSRWSSEDYLRERLVLLQLDGVVRGDLEPPRLCARPQRELLLLGADSWMAGSHARAALRFAGHGPFPSVAAPIQGGGSGEPGFGDSGGPIVHGHGPDAELYAVQNALKLDPVDHRWWAVAIPISRCRDWLREITRLELGEAP